MEERLTSNEVPASDRPRTPVLEIKELTKTYQTDAVKVEALRGINLTIYKGEFIILAGPSGCGKSTLLSLVGCLDYPTSGKIFLEGIDPTNLDRQKIALLRNKKIGFVFQMFNLLPELNVTKNVQLPLIYAGIPKRERERRAQSLLSELNLAHRSSHKPAQISGGERQRVAIARALITNPSLILADEPTGNLDSNTSQSILEVLKELNRKTVTIFLVTHNPEVARYGTRIIDMKDGKLI